MARTIARLQVVALEDPHFQALTPTAQWTYWVILQQRRLTLAGSIDYQPGRWAGSSVHADPGLIRQGVDELAAGDFVIVDDDTGELLIRTFVKHDLDTSRLSAPTIKGFWGAWEGIYSKRLRGRVVEEITGELWERLKVHAPPEAVNIRTTGPVRTGTPAPVPAGTGTPATDQTCRKPETPRSTPLEREPAPPSEQEQPPPSEVPVDCRLSTVDVSTQVVSPTGLGTPPPTSTDDDETKPNLDQLARAVAKARSKRLGGGHNPVWIRTTAARLNRAAITEALANGHTSPAELDLILDGIRDQPPTTVHPAIAATRHACETCDGMHSIEQDDGTVTPCPNCTTGVHP